MKESTNDQFPGFTGSCFLVCFVLSVDFYTLKLTTRARYPRADVCKKRVRAIAIRLKHADIY